MNSNEHFNSQKMNVNKHLGEVLTIVNVYEFTSYTKIETVEHGYLAVQFANCRKYLAEVWKSRKNPFKAKFTMVERFGTKIGHVDIIDGENASGAYAEDAQEKAIQHATLVEWMQYHKGVPKDDAAIRECANTLIVSLNAVSEAFEGGEIDAESASFVERSLIARVCEMAYARGYKAAKEAA